MDRKRMGTTYQKPTEQEIKHYDYADIQPRDKDLEHGSNNNQAQGPSPRRK